MNKKRQSRGPELDMEKIKENSGGLYQIIPKTAGLARAIKRKNRHSENPEHIFPILTAMKIIQQQ